MPFAAGSASDEGPPDDCMKGKNSAPTADAPPATSAEDGAEDALQQKACFSVYPVLIFCLFV